MKNKLVLVLEDEPLLGELICEIFSEHGINSFWAEEVDQAIDAFQKKQVSAAVVDLNLKHSSGIDFISFLNAQTFQVPFIVLSGHIGEKEIQQVMDLGALAFVSKPFDKKSLLGLVNKILLL